MQYKKNIFHTKTRVDEIFSGLHNPIYKIKTIDADTNQYIPKLGA